MKMHSLRLLQAPGSATMLFKVKPSLHPLQTVSCGKPGLWLSEIICCTRLIESKVLTFGQRITKRSQTQNSSAKRPQALKGCQTRHLSMQNTKKRRSGVCSRRTLHFPIFSSNDQDHCLTVSLEKKYIYICRLFRMSIFFCLHIHDKLHFEEEGKYMIVELLVFFHLEENKGDCFPLILKRVYCLMKNEVA